MKAALRFLGLPGLILPLLVAAGCASKNQAGRPPSQVTPDLEQRVLRNPAATARLKNYAGVELKAVNTEAAPVNRAEDDLARRLDRELYLSLEPLWKKVTPVPRSVGFTQPAPGVLLIEPLVTETRLATSLDREILSWTKGDSYIAFKVIFRDGATGESLAEPVFYRKADNFWASWYGSGPTDREIERGITDDVVNYVRDNY